MAKNLFIGVDLGGTSMRAGVVAKDGSLGPLEKRKTHPNAYKPWTDQEEEDLAARCAQGVLLAELAQEFGRNKGAIASRLMKIGAVGPAAHEAQEFGG